MEPAASCPSSRDCGAGRPTGTRRGSRDGPGTVHGIRTSSGHPPIVYQGLEAAKCYAAVAPDAPNAQHMPSHVFTRVGYGRQLIESNRRSARVDAGQGAAARTEVSRPHALPDAASKRRLGYRRDQIEIQAQVVQGLVWCRAW